MKEEKNSGLSQDLNQDLLNSRECTYNNIIATCMYMHVCILYMSLHVELYLIIKTLHNLHTASSFISDSLCYSTCYNIQWRKKMFLNRGAVNKIARKARKNFFGSHNTPSNHAHYYANLAVK